MPYLLQHSFPTSPLSTFSQYTSRPANTPSTPGPRSARRSPVAVPCHKSMPTCTISLAHAEVVSAPPSDLTGRTDAPGLFFAPQLSVHLPNKPILSRTTHYRSREINIIPFPMLTPESSLPHAISSRPLPIPPKSHGPSRMTPMGSPPGSSFSLPQARSPLEPELKRTRRDSGSSQHLSDSRSSRVAAAPIMQRRRSRDPNVADRLVVEADDGDVMPPRPYSPSSEPIRQVSCGQSRKDELVVDAPPPSPDQAAPPAYSSLPPPYSPANGEEKKDGEEQTLVDTSLPSTTAHKPSISKPPTPPSSASPSSAGPSCSTYKRTRVSTSELRVLLYLYRTVVYGLEMRRRKETESGTTEEKQETLPQDAASKTKRKPLGPRSSPCATPVLRAGEIIPEDNHQFESFASAISAKVRGKLKQPNRGFGAFPLVEDDMDLPESDVEGTEYITPRTPFHSPSQSPRSTPPLILRPLSPIPSDSKPKQKEKTKADLNTELDVQDKLLSIRLRDFLKAQGICEEDLTVEFDLETGDEKVEKVVEEVQTEPQVSQVLSAEEEEENNILEEYFMGIEEEEHPSRPRKERGPIVEEDDDIVAGKIQAPFVDDLALHMARSTTPISSQPPLQVVIQPPAIQRISSPPPASPSPRPRAVLPTSYMVAILTMRNRHPSKKPGSSNNGASGVDKNKDAKKKSGLSVVVEAD